MSLSSGYSPTATTPTSRQLLCDRSQCMPLTMQLLWAEVGKKGTVYGYWGSGGMEEQGIAGITHGPVM